MSTVPTAMPIYPGPFGVDSCMAKQGERAMHPTDEAARVAGCGLCSWDDPAVLRGDATANKLNRCLQALRPE
jgi:hypothetical protein